MNPFKGYIVGAIGIVLLLSVLGNWWLFDQLQDAREAAGKADSERVQAIVGLDACNTSVASLEKAAVDQAEASKPQIAEAAAVAIDHGKKAQIILQTPPSDPNNDCRSAQTRIESWLKGRAL